MQKQIKGFVRSTMSWSDSLHTSLPALLPSWWSLKSSNCLSSVFWNTLSLSLVDFEGYSYGHEKLMKNLSISDFFIYIVFISFCLINLY